MNNIDRNDHLLIAEEVAAILRIKASTLKKNMSFNPSSVPPGIKLGNSSNSPVRWRRKTVEAWLEEKEEDTNHQQLGRCGM